MSKLSSRSFIVSCLLTATLVTAQAQNVYHESENESLDSSSTLINQYQDNNNKAALSWEDSINNFSIIVDGLNFKDVADFTWNGIIVTDVVKEMINGLQAEIREKQNGFIFSVNGESYKEDGSFGFVLNSGEIFEINVPIIPVPSERKRAPNKLNAHLMPYALSAGSTCGGYSDASNPYPCCDNGSKPDGNCTWYVWYRAHQTNRGWGVALPAWGNAKSWCDNAKKAGYTVSSNPRGAEQGYSIGCNSSGTYGHVAWVWKYDNKYVWVDEQNCCNCSVAGTRIGAKYARSYFKYIYKK